MDISGNGEDALDELRGELVRLRKDNAPIQD
jgi:hypothetical protein